jgi:hypothetical protein
MERKEAVPGMRYIRDFISREQELELVKEINVGKWNTDLKRRTQHFGYRYAYDKNNTLEKEQPIPETFVPVKQLI